MWLWLSLRLNLGSVHHTLPSHVSRTAREAVSGCDSDCREVALRPQVSTLQKLPQETNFKHNRERSNLSSKLNTKNYHKIPCWSDSLMKMKTTDLAQCWWECNDRRSQSPRVEIKC